MTVDRAEILGTITGQISDLEKCIKLSAQNAIRNVKFRSNQRKANRFSAGNASGKRIQGSKCINAAAARVLT